jgi:hypothetical protein
MSTARLINAHVRSNLQRETNAEVRARDMLMDQDLKDLRQAAEAHRQVRPRTHPVYVALTYHDYVGPQVRAVLDQARHDHD